MFIRKWFNTSFRLQLLHKFTFTAMGAIKYLYRNRLLIGKHDTKFKPFQPVLTTWQMNCIVIIIVHTIWKQAKIFKME